VFNHSVNKHNAVAVVSEEASLKERTDTVTEEWCIVFPIYTVGKVNIASGFRWHTTSSEQYCTLLFVVTDGQGIQDSRYTTESLSYPLCTQLKSSRCLLTLFEHYLSHVSLKPAIIKQGVISQSVCPSGH
jgi:hypothetical protein